MKQRKQHGAAAPVRGIVTNSTDAAVFKDATPVNFIRDLKQAQPDEKQRYDAIYDNEIAPYYTAEAVDNARISSQFLDEGDPVSHTTRELLVLLETPQDAAVEMAHETGDYLGFLGLLPGSKVLLSKQTLAGKAIIIVTFPEYGEADLYGFDPHIGENGLYAFGETVMLP